eukprot:jgi/Mesvir1/874/Mv25108-RA.2
MGVVAHSLASAGLLVGSLVNPSLSSAWLLAAFFASAYQTRARRHVVQSCPSAAAARSRVWLWVTCLAFCSLLSQAGSLFIAELPSVIHHEAATKRELRGWTQVLLSLVGWPSCIYTPKERCTPADLAWASGPQLLSLMLACVAWGLCRWRGSAVTPHSDEDHPFTLWDYLACHGYAPLAALAGIAQPSLLASPYLLLVSARLFWGKWGPPPSAAGGRRVHPSGKDRRGPPFALLLYALSHACTLYIYNVPDVTHILSEGALGRPWTTWGLYLLPRELPTLATAPLFIQAGALIGLIVMVSLIVICCVQPRHPLFIQAGALIGLIVMVSLIVICCVQPRHPYSSRPAL